jgi:DNA polymerase-3 subunit alpha
VTTEKLAEAADGKEVKLCGIVTTVKTTLTKKGDRMAYIQLEDLQGLVEIIVFPDLYRTAEPLLVPERLVQVTGIVDRADKGSRIKGTKIESLAEVQTRSVSRVVIRLDDHPEAPGRLRQLQAIVQRHPGPAPVSLTLRLTPTLEADTTPLPALGVLPAEPFVSEVEAVLGKGSVALL